MGLANALKSYDPSKGVPLKYWVYRFINSEIIKCRYKNNKERREDSGHEKIFDKLQSSTPSPLEALQEQEEQNIRKQKYKQAYKCLLQITKDDLIGRHIFIDRILNGCKLTEVAIKYHMSTSGVLHKTNKLTRDIKNCLKLK